MAITNIMMALLVIALIYGGSKNSFANALRKKQWSTVVGVTGDYYD